MYWLDTAILLILGIGVAWGAVTGLWWQIARFLSLGVSFAATILGHDPAMRLVQDGLGQMDPRLLHGLAYVAVFLAVYLCLYYLTHLVYEMIRAGNLEYLDRLLGALLGGAKVSLILAAVCLGLANYPNPTTKQWMASSQFAPTFADGMEFVLLSFPEDYKADLQESLVNLRDLMKNWSQEKSLERVKQH